jgi:hypothetical protein
MIDPPIEILRTCDVNTRALQAGLILDALKALTVPFLVVRMESGEIRIANPQEFSEAMVWIMSNDTFDPICFRECCEDTETNFRKVRREARRLAALREEMMARFRAGDTAGIKVYWAQQSDHGKRCEFSQGKARVAAVRTFFREAVMA